MTDIPETMKAMVLTGQGDYDKLQYKDVPVPEIGKGEVLIKVLAAGVNNTEINVRLAWYAQDEDSEEENQQLAEGVWEGGGVYFPRIQGADACGEIVAVGEGVDESRIGDRVIVEPLFRNPVKYFGAECDGAFAEYTVAPTENAHKVESDLSNVELASFPCSYSTAENLVSRAGVSAGDVVLVTGASGGVGSAAVQLAARRGAEVIGVVRDDKADKVKAIGASRTVDRDADLVETLGINSVDVVIDLVGGEEWPHLLTVMRSRGRYATSGAIAGPVVTLDLRTMYFKDLSLFGCTAFEPEVFKNLVSYIEKGEIKPVISGTYKLTDIAQAQEDFLKKKHVGKLVLEL
ncbi:alcohol dehydrogenase family protein [Roseovarius indicus]|uniref:Alcohol dehydrogenase n=1 Tax=Roseovarius indicus TaxID=540747 RepID=A0A0T5P1K4_9RHOB|nr:alcohol dehydrogenase family protein [Roseovarius indicus]KRS15021.1 alcohol dehydrogenase [Roseovarius indicus]QEW25338.1 Crotonyl-CoA reductase [Roseovarius indicus]SFE21048.1 NADPH:quinone reductase [Roseovarius indicus]